MKTYGKYDTPRRARRAQRGREILKDVIDPMGFFHGNKKPRLQFQAGRAGVVSPYATESGQRAIELQRQRGVQDARADAFRGGVGSAGQSSGLGRLQAARMAQAGVADANRESSTQGALLEQQRAQQGFEAGLAGQRADVDLAVGEYQARMGKPGKNTAAAGAFGNTLVGFVKSGLDAKKNIKSEEDEIQETMRQLYAAQGDAMSHMPDPSQDPAVEMVRRAPAISYDYKNPDGAGRSPGRKVGTAAEALEQTPLGKTVVTRGPDGEKRVDAGHLTMLNTAAQGAQQREVDQVRAEQEKQNALMERLLSARDDALSYIPDPLDPEGRTYTGRRKALARSRAAAPQDILGY